MSYLSNLKNNLSSQWNCTACYDAFIRLTPGFCILDSRFLVLNHSNPITSKLFVVVSNNLCKSHCIQWYDPYSYKNIRITLLHLVCATCFNVYFKFVCRQRLLKNTKTVSNQHMLIMQIMLIFASTCKCNLSSLQYVGKFCTEMKFDPILLSIL